MRHLLLPTLLLVADHPSVRAFFKRHLEAKFFLLYATRKSQALEAVSSSALDLIIVDASLDDCDAIQLCRELRSRMATAPIPMLLITGRLNKDFRDQASEAGVTDFLHDQLEESELEQHIAVALKTTAVRQKTARLAAKIAAPRPLQLQGDALRLFAQAKAPVTTLVVHLDHFEALRAKLGADAAERLSAEATAVLQRRLAGGDALLPFTEGQGVVLLRPGEEPSKLAELLKNTLAEHVFEVPQGTLHLTASVAISQATQQSLQRVVNAATQALEAQGNALLWMDPHA